MNGGSGYGKRSAVTKAILCAAVCLALVTAAFFHLDTKKAGTATMAAENSLPLYDSLVPESGCDRLQLLNNEAGVQFRTDAPFTGIRIYIPKAASGGSGVSFRASLYRWAGGIGETLRALPVAECYFTGIRSGDRPEFDLTAGGTLAPPEGGEYVLLIGSAKGSVHVGTVPSSGVNARTYYNRSPVNGFDAAVDIIHAGNGCSLLPVSENKTKFVTTADTWVVTDGLGRKVGNSYTDTRRAGKTVGLFFHTWHSSNAPSGTRNITSILKEHPEIQNDYGSKLWGNAGAYFWNEPVWGYYRSDDEWVLRKQAELLADAGVDAVFFDNTNGTATFIDDVLTLCKVWSVARADGVNTPKISFMLPMFEYNDVAVQLREIYGKLYGRGLYQDLWFYWKGKPLMVGYPGRLDPDDAADREILDFFNYRVINHAQSEDHVQVMGEDGVPVVMGAIQKEVTDSYQLWNWISVYPQLVNRNPDGTPEQVAVAIAHNWCAETHLTAMNNPKYQVFGRHYDPVKGAVDSRENAKLYGAYFSAQWEYALGVDPEFIWVTGWNEWVAGRFRDFWGVENAFPDNFSDEYSRDIEPSRGDLKDHYYYQLVDFIRRYKGTGAAPAPQGPVTVDVASGAGWEKVTNRYETYPGDTGERHANGYVSNETRRPFRYDSATGRNDITGAKASYDSEYVYFMAETASELTPYTDPAWMRLFIEVGSVNGRAPEAPSWESFHYIVNRESPADGSHTVIERSTGGWNWEKAGDVMYSAAGNVIQAAVPKSALGLSGEDSFVINFKWADNIRSDGDILDFYVSGDVAPEGRFKYQLVAGEIPAPGKERRGPDALAVGAGIACGAAAVAAAAAVVAAVRPGRKERE